MNVLSLHSVKHPLHFSTISCSYKPPNTQFSAKTIPPRDRIIDFGKFKGKMLGTLPSTYLKWVSKNLRARDFEEWAKLADEVLTDPIYKDRIEWELAEKLLNGEVLTSPLVQESNHNAVSELLEMSERFGWDNEDKEAWSRIDFKLLGTSKGGRIPRVCENRSVTKTDSLHAEAQGIRIPRVGENRSVTKTDSLYAETTRLRALQSCNKNEGRKMGLKKDEVRVCDKELEERRKERRERLRLSKSSSNSSDGLQMKRAMERMEKMGIDDNDKGNFGIGEKVRLKGKQDIDEDRVVKVQSPFPGREALLKKVLNRRKVV